MSRLFIALFACLWLVPSSAFAQGPQAGMMERALGRVPPVATAQRDESIAAGTVRTTVVDEQDQPVEGASVRIGIMEQGGKRSQEVCSTDGRGICAVDSLPTGSIHSYRVSVSYEGAKYGSTPFRLDGSQGYAVRIRRLPTTTDSQRLLQILGRTMLEFKDDRMRVSQESRLTNLGDAAYVFPPEGLLVQLPKGFLVFDSRAVMTDQRIVADDEGFRIFGSLPPGRVALTWGYELPLTGSTFEFVHTVPFRTIEYDVLTDYVEGISLSVEGFAPPVLHEHRGRPIYWAKLVRRPSDPPLNELRLQLTGIPSGTVLPLVAAVLAVLLIFVGVALTVTATDQTAFLERARAHRRNRLLEEAAQLEKDLRSGEVGPKFHERRRHEIVDELAALLQLDAKPES